MLQTYRRVLVVPGAAAFSLTGLVARLPISMVSLGLVLLVASATGSYGRAGLVAAAYTLAQAVATIVHGRLADTLGQARALPPPILVFGAGLSATAWSVEAGLPTGWTVLLAAVAGSGLPQVGACVRARWAHVLHEPSAKQTAFALEAVVDEVVFIVGPVVVTLLATGVDPLLGLGVAVVAGVGGTLALAGQQATQPPPAPRGRRSPGGAAREPMPWGDVVPLTVVCLCLGGLFGSVEVVTVAYAEEAGSPGAAGPLLAVFAAGSLLAGVVVGARTWRRGPEHRLRWGMTGLTLAMVPPAYVGPPWLMALVLLLGGLAISPTLIAAMSLAEAIVPPVRLTEGIAILSTGISAGLAPGAALAGLAVDAYGASPAYLVCAAAGVVGVAAVLLVRAPAAAPTLGR